MEPRNRVAKRRARHAVALAVRTKVYVALDAKASADVCSVLAVDTALPGLLALLHLGLAALLDGSLGPVDTRGKELRDRLAVMTGTPILVLGVFAIQRLGVGLPRKQLVEAFLRRIRRRLDFVELPHLLELVDGIVRVVRVVVEACRADDHALLRATTTEADVAAEVPDVRNSWIADEPRRSVFGLERPLAGITVAFDCPLVRRGNFEVVDIQLAALRLFVDHDRTLRRVAHRNAVLDAVLRLPGETDGLRPIRLTGLLRAGNGFGGKAHLLAPVLDICEFLSACLPVHRHIRLLRVGKQWNDRASCGLDNFDFRVSRRCGYKRQRQGYYLFHGDIIL